MDVFEMLDALEELIEVSVKIPLTNKAVVNAEDILDYVDQIRSVLPEEIRQARWVAKERDRLLVEAQQEAERVMEEARSQINKLAEESEVVKKANERAEEIISKAQNISQDIKLGSEAYADEILAKLEESMIRALETIQQGRSELNHSKLQKIV